jgi:hypothetical protein
MLVGAFAMAAHGYPRATMDIDFWVLPSADNAKTVISALKKFGAPLHNLKQDDLVRGDTIFQIGLAPRRIDIITGASGLTFELAYDRSVVVDVDGYDVHIPCIEDLIVNKRASGRTKDLADAEALEDLNS